MNRKNENRTGYKKTKAGWIPEEWDWEYCDNIASLISGGTPSTNKEVYWDGSIPWITSADIEDGKVNKIRYHISEDGLRNSSAQIVEKGTILLVSRTGVGKIAIAPFDLSFSQDTTAILHNTSNLDSKYFFYFLDFSEQYFKKNQRGTSIKGITKEVIGNVKIFLPKMFEQKQIVKILSAWDWAIEQVRKLIDAKQRIKKGLMQQLLTGRMRFPEFGRSAKKRGEVPEGWKVIRLGKCFKERKEYNTRLPLLSITSNKGVIPKGEIDRKDTSNNDKSKYKLITQGDIGYNTMRMWQGVSALSTLEGIVSPAYTICIPQKGYDSKFFSYLFKSPDIIHLFHRFSQGLVSDTLNLKYNHFSQIKVKVPNLREQKRIYGTLSSLDQNIMLLQKEETALKQQKKGLMRKLLTGEIRANNYKEDKF